MPDNNDAPFMRLHGRFRNHDIFHWKEKQRLTLVSRFYWHFELTWNITFSSNNRTDISSVGRSDAVRCLCSAGSAGSADDLTSTYPNTNTNMAF